MKGCATAPNCMGWGLKLAVGLVSLVFLLSGGIKVLDPARFLLDVLGFALLPYPLAFATALVLPWMEVVAGLAVLTNCGRRGAAAVLAALTLSFIVGLLVAEMRGLNLECGCFGDWLVFPNTGVHVAFNSLLVAALAFIWRQSANSPR